MFKNYLCLKERKINRKGVEANKAHKDESVSCDMKKSYRDGFLEILGDIFEASFIPNLN